MATKELLKKMWWLIGVVLQTAEVAVLGSSLASSTMILGHCRVTVERWPPFAVKKIFKLIEYKTCVFELQYIYE